MQQKVALRTEGVDRNIRCVMVRMVERVALRTEGVDRNEFLKTMLDWYVCRPPYGGRG